MNKTIHKKSFAISAILIIALFSQASDFGKSNISELFKVRRSKNTDEVFYTLKTTKNGNLDVNEPINIFWLKCTKKGKLEPLTKIQQQYSYGLNYLNIGPDSADFHFMAFPDRLLKLRKNNKGEFCVYTNINGKEEKLDQVFIQFDGGSFLMPKISKVELRAKNHNANKLVVEVIQP